MRLSTLSSVAVCLAMASSAGAQSVDRFPSLSDGTFPGTDLPVIRIAPNVIRDFAQTPATEMRLNDFQLDANSQVDLDLRRIDLDRMNFGFHVDGQATPGLLDGLDLSVWTGTVVGEPNSDVLISFSNAGTRGWVKTGLDQVHLMPQPETGNNWSESYTIVARDTELAELGATMDGDFCKAGEIQDMIRPLEELATSGPAKKNQGGGMLAGVGGCSTWQASISIETDFQLFQVFGDLGAETSYITTLLAAASDRYETQINTVLTYPYVQFYTNSNDPWSTPDIPGSSSAMLNEFETAWNGSIPMGSDIGHLVSGANLGGGIAYLGVLCDDANFSFAVSGNISGQVPFPIVVSPLNWDFMVFTHETGHNFNSPHTHDYSPQIDDCAASAPSGAGCTSSGTIMSYCHQCDGGLANVTTFFHPTVVNVMQAHANACLPNATPLINPTGPQLIAPGNTAALTVQLQGTPISGVDLNYRFTPGSYTVIPASNQGGGIWSASLPTAQCGDSPEWFFSTTEVTCGFYQTALDSAQVANQTITVDEMFEANSGWTAGVGGDTATTGQWTRGDPNGTTAQPENDHTPSGTDCFFTGQAAPGAGLGDNDVDGGFTTLVSPVYDLSGGDSEIGYYRWYSNDSSASPNADIFTVDISNNGGGSWTNVETIGPAGAGTSGGWIYHQFTVSDFVTPTANVQVRFVAEDAGSGSIIEAAVDDLQVFTLDCGGDPWVDVGGGAPGVLGTPVLDMSGPLTPGSTLTLNLTQGAPSELAFVWFSFASTPAPFLGGTLHAFPINIQLLAFTSPFGSLAGSAPFPGGTSGDEIWVQVGVTDATTAFGGSLSNAMMGTVP